MNLINGDCLDVLKTLPENSIDSLVTDPPAGISFMNKSWDDDKGGRDEWIKWLSEVMKECRRVLKPGAHGLVWSLPRTSHWTAMALEYAGFEVRDCITHLFGQGFPKSLNISIAIDKEAKVDRDIIGYIPHTTGIQRNNSLERNELLGGNTRQGKLANEMMPITKPKTEYAKKYDGYGTALKPAAEFWWLIRKPISEKTVAKNILKWGTGGLNIDGCRVESKNPIPCQVSSTGSGYGKYDSADYPNKRIYSNHGRFPANLVLSHSEYCTDDICDIECAIKQLDEQSIAGGMHSAGYKKESEIKASPSFGIGGLGKRNPDIYKDSGGASRFFYCAKISSKERNEGCENLEKKLRAETNKMMGKSGAMKTGSGNDRTTHFKNNHPTVKPKKLMTYLCRLITPHNGTILDPFMGSGSTGIAAKLEGFNFIGIEKEKEYFEIADKRIKF